MQPSSMIIELAVCERKGIVYRSEYEEFDIPLFCFDLMPFVL